MNDIILSLGTNVGNKVQNLVDAIEFLKEKIEIYKISSIYKSEPMYFEEQDYFYNCVVAGYTNFFPEELLMFVKNIEKKMGRKKIFRNGPRIIDIDIVFFNYSKYEFTNLKIPHPDYLNRNFVLYPMAEILPNIKLPEIGIELRTYLENKNFDCYIEKLNINDWIAI